MLFLGLFVIVIGWFLSFHFIVVLGQSIIGLWFSYQVILTALVIGQSLLLPPIRSIGQLIGFIGKILIWGIGFALPKNNPAPTNNNTSRERCTRESTIDYNIFNIQGKRQHITNLDIAKLDAIGPGRAREAHQRIQEYLSSPHHQLEYSATPTGSDGIPNTKLKRGKYDIGRTLIHYGYARPSANAPQEYWQSDSLAQERLNGAWGKNGNRLPPLRNILS